MKNIKFKQLLLLTAVVLATTVVPCNSVSAQETENAIEFTSTKIVVSEDVQAIETETEPEETELVPISLEGTFKYEDAWELFELINAERAKYELEPLKMDKELLDSAMTRAVEAQLYLSYTRPDGTAGTSISTKSSRELLCGGGESASIPVTEWMKESLSRNYILSESYTVVGIGCFTQGTVNYWTLLVGDGEYEEATDKKNTSVTKAIDMDTQYMSFAMDVYAPCKVYTTMTEKNANKLVLLNAGWDEDSTAVLPSSVTWTSSDTKLFTVDTEGFMTGKQVGTGTLTATLKADTSVVKKLAVEVLDLYSISQPKNVVAKSAGKNKVELNWEASDNATHYLIYAKKDGVYAYCGMTTGQSNTKFTDTQALDTDYNFYWVFPVKEVYNGQFHVGPKADYVYGTGVTPAVLGLKASSKTNGVELTWEESTDAEGYVVYGKRGNGSYGYIGMTTQGTTFLDTKALSTEYNYYWVFPYHVNNEGKVIAGAFVKNIYGKAL